MFPDMTHLPDGSTVTLPAGIHYLTEPIRITGRNIRIVGEDGAELHAALPLSDHPWHCADTGKGIWYTDIDRPADALYVGSRKYRMARYPKYSSEEKIFGGYAADCISPEKTAFWKNPAGGYIHAIHRHMWGGYSYKITGKNEDGTLALIGGYQNNRQMGMHEEYRYAENIYEELTEPGEWYFDEEKCRIYVIPYPDDDLQKASAAVSHNFFVLDGCENVTIENITFAHGSRTFMQTAEPLLRSDWTIFRGGAVVLRGSKNCTLDRCRFYDIGSNAVFADGRNEQIRITRCHFERIGASGICFVGHPDSVRNPLFEYNETQSIHSIDTTPGPKSENYPRRCLVEDCLISYTGETEKQSAGIQISMASGIHIRNCTICHTPRAGINISEGTFGGHRIEGCDVFDTVRETGDHGSFNSWGRDRFWHAQDLSDEDARQYALLDCVEPTVLRRNRFRCDHGWDIDLDDGSSNYIIEENLCLAGGIKLREGFERKVFRNITVNNTVHFHVWYPSSGDVVEQNIVFRPYAPVAMPARWGESVNANILYLDSQDTADPVQQADVLRTMTGQDADSIAMHCRFRMPEMSDYVPEDLPDFRNFPTVFGVRYEPLRRIADHPEIPSNIRSEAAGTSSDVIREWNGMRMKNITSDGEMSVYGTAGHRGVLVLEVSSSCEAASRGINSGDVIVSVGDRKIDSIDDLGELKKWPPDTPAVILRKHGYIELK